MMAVSLPALMVVVHLMGAVANPFRHVLIVASDNM